MADEPLTVRTGTLRGGATRLAGTAYRLGHGLAGTPGLVVDEPGWAAGAALAGLESAGHTWLGSVGARVATFGTGLHRAADDYDAADDRAARRLAGT